MKFKYPSGSGPAKCKGCGGKGYAWYGEGPDGKFSYTSACFEGWDPKTKTYAPCTKSLISNSGPDTV